MLISLIFRSSFCDRAFQSASQAIHRSICHLKRKELAALWSYQPGHQTKSPCLPAFQACPAIEFVRLLQTLLPLPPRARQPSLDQLGRVQRFHSSSRNALPCSTRPVCVLQCVVRAMRGIMCLGPNSGRKPDVFILNLDDIRIFTEDLGQGYIATIEWPEPKSVGKIVCLRVVNSSWTSDGLPHHLPPSSECKWVVSIARWAICPAGRWWHQRWGWVMAVRLRL